MKKKTRVFIPPPPELRDYGPSALFRYFVEAGGWDYGSFASDISEYNRQSVVSIDAVSDWANDDVLPKRYRAALYRLIQDQVEASVQQDWKNAFLVVWAEHKALKKKRPQSTDIQQSQPAYLVLGPELFDKLKFCISLCDGDAEESIFIPISFAGQGLEASDERD